VVRLRSRLFLKTFNITPTNTTQYQTSLLPLLITYVYARNTLMMFTLCFLRLPEFENRNPQLALLYQISTYCDRYLPESVLPLAQDVMLN